MWSRSSLLVNLPEGGSGTNVVESPGSSDSRSRSRTLRSHWVWVRRTNLAWMGSPSRGSSTPGGGGGGTSPDSPDSSSGASRESAPSSRPSFAESSDGLPVSSPPLSLQGSFALPSVTQAHKKTVAKAVGNHFRLVPTTSIDATEEAFLPRSGSHLHPPAFVFFIHFRPREHFIA